MPFACRRGRTMSQAVVDDELLEELFHGARVLLAFEQAVNLISGHRSPSDSCQTPIRTIVLQVECMVGKDAVAERAVQESQLAPRRWRPSFLPP
jgi:hypothetical protein